MHGRQVIFTDQSEVSRDNVVQILTSALTVHKHNKAEIDYLWNYYKGKHPILARVKDYRPEICNKVVVNIPYEIVSFDTGYLMGEPVQYSSRTDNIKEVNLLNSYMLLEEKAPKDKEIADWFHICGTSYRMVLPDPYDDEDYAPFEIYTLDPRHAFVVYNYDLGNKPVLGVKYVTDSEGVIHYSCYSRDTYFEITNTSVVREEPHLLGEVPIIEYPLNQARLGAFEVVLELCDAIDTANSNRLDGVEQFVQALMLFHNMDISTDDFKSLKEMGALKYKDIDPQMKASVQYLTSELNQTETQTLVDHMYDMILTICGIPNRNGGSSTSDTGIAVVYRDGWSAAESNAKATEMSFKRSERQLLRIVARICQKLRNFRLKGSDVDINFTRRNYENIVSKANVLTGMLSNDKIHPKLAFEHCGMFYDPDTAYMISKEYYDDQVKSGAGEADRGDSGTGSQGGTPDREWSGDHRGDTQEDA